MDERTGRSRQEAGAAGTICFRMFGRMSGQKTPGSLTIRQEYTVCYSTTRVFFVRHEPDIPETYHPGSPRLLPPPTLFFLLVYRDWDGFDDFGGDCFFNFLFFGGS